MVTIIPAILTDDVHELTNLIRKCEGKTQCVQIDIIDGVFADNKTVDPSAARSLDTKLFIDYHLMVKEPIDWVEKCVVGQATRVIGQVEMMMSQKMFIEEVKEHGLQVGLALDIDTPIEKLDPAVLYAVDVVLLMSVKAGFGGQEFNTKVLQKIQKLDHVRAQDELS